MRTHLTLSSVGQFLLGVLVVSAPALSQTTGACGTWARAHSPSPGDFANGLTGITATSVTDLWAVGSTQDFQMPVLPLVLQWGGTSWGTVPLPDSLLRTSLAGVGSTPGGDVWAVGTHRIGNARTDARVLRLRDGALVDAVRPDLRRQSVYPFTIRSGFPADADGTGPDDVWAVGSASGFGDGLATTVGLALHWDGTDWADVDVPLVSDRTHDLNAVAALAPDDVWAVGHYRESAGAYHALVVHWYGTAWEHVPTPAESTGQTFLFDVAAIAPDDVWAVGEQPDGALFMHWDGTAWSIAPSPVSVTTRIASVASVASDDVWAAATLGSSSFFHWDGAAWTEVPVPGPAGASFFARSGGLAATGPCAVWSVGSMRESDVGYTFIEHLQEPLPDVTIEYLSSTPDPQRREWIYIQARVTNHEPERLRALVSFDVTSPTSETTHYNVLSRVFPPGRPVDVHTLKDVRFRLRANAPAGTYTVTLNVGERVLEGGAIYDTDTFTFDLPAASAGVASGPSEASLVAGAPASLALRAPSPNPARGVVSLGYDVPRTGPVVLVVYDVLGREVAVAASGEHAPGRYTAHLNVADLPTGLYTVRLTSGPESLSRRVTVMR